MNTLPLTVIAHVHGSMDNHLRLHMHLSDTRYSLELPLNASCFTVRLELEANHSREPEAVRSTTTTETLSPISETDIPHQGIVSLWIPQAL